MIRIEYNKSCLHNNKLPPSLQIHPLLGDHLLLAEQIFLLMLFQVVTWSFHIQKHCVGSSDVGQINFCRFSFRCQQRACCDKLDRVSKSSLWTYFGQEL